MITCSKHCELEIEDAFPCAMPCMACDGWAIAIAVAMLGIEGAEHSSRARQRMTNTSLEAQGTDRSQGAQYAGTLAQQSSPGPEAIEQQRAALTLPSNSPRQQRHLEEPLWNMGQPIGLQNYPNSP